MRNLLLATFCFQLLFVSSLGYSIIQMNKKSNVTIFERHNHHKRANAPLGGGAGRVGYYYVEMQIGSQQFRVDIDTGSSTLFIVGPDCHYLESPSTPCTYAQSYYQGGAAYMGCKNGCYSCQKSVCIMHAAYGDGSQVYGAVKNEAIQIGGYTTTGPAAVSYLQSESFANIGGTTHMDGLWGMAYSRLNGGLPTVMDNLVTSGMPNIFSMCFSRYGGYLVMGGIETSFQTSAPSYTPITDQGYYSISMSGIAVGGNDLDVSMPSSFIVDSGTTLNYVSPQIMEALRQALKGYSYPDGWINQGGDILCSSSVIPATFPTITMTFPQVGGGTFTLSMSGRQYMIQCETNGLGNAYAFGFLPAAGINILGDAFMQGFNTIFDRVHGQVGFAPVNAQNCNGYVAINTQSYSVPGTKSQFSSATILMPPILFLASGILFALAL